jgi:methyltransferase-like protein/SAM-dependent methyltransferase
MDRLMHFRSNLAYDSVPYESYPFPQSHPARLAALACLFGLRTAAVGQARILELGCASGGNIIPLAKAFPQAEFVGVDLSSVQIAEGRARIDALRLDNIVLRQANIADLTAQDGKFDYIICHGVYSWVPRPVREAIFRVYRENLARNGVGFISYNVFPGWRLKGIVRDAMRYHVGGELNPHLKVQKARWLVSQLATLSPEQSSYGQALREEAKFVAARSDSYILHEFLEIENEPCYFQDFLRETRANRLEYLTETELFMTIPETFGPAIGGLLRSVSNNVLDLSEQYVDFFTGRAFRQSLLVHETQKQSIQRNITIDRLNGLYIVSKFHPEAMRDGDGFVFHDRSGRTLSTRSEFVQCALSRLATQFPRNQRPEDLLRDMSISHNPTPQDEFDLRDALLKLVCVGMADVSTVPVHPAKGDAEKPHALDTARLDARSARSWTTNLHHERVELGLVDRILLPMLDGTNDHDALRAGLLAAVAKEELRFERNGMVITAEAELVAAATEHLNAALGNLALRSVLVPA